MNKYYRVTAYEIFIPIAPPYSDADGGMDSVTYAGVWEAEAEAIPRNTAINTKGRESRITETYFDSYGAAAAMADLLEPGYPHYLRRIA